MNKSFSGIVITVLAIGLGRYVGGHLMEGRGGSVDPLMKPYIEEFQTNPKYKAKFEGLDEKGAYQQAFKLASTGAKRLPAQELVARLQIVGQILETADVETCGGIVLGQNPAYFSTAFEALPEDTRKQWIDLSFKAVKAEIDEVDFIPPEDEQVQRAFLELTAQMEDADREMVMRVMKSMSLGFPPVTGEEACRAARLIYQSVPKINRQSQEAVAKTFVL